MQSMDIRVLTRSNSSDTLEFFLSSTINEHAHLLFEHETPMHVVLSKKR